MVVLLTQECPEEQVSDIENDDDFVESVGSMIDYYMDLRGNPPEDCQALAKAVMQSIRERYQGERVTIRKRTSSIKRQIRAEFNGQNIEEIMHRYGVSRATVYRYLGRK